MKIRILIICSAMIPVIFQMSSYSQDIFKPWDADVKIGDENCDIKSNSSSNTESVFSGPQGGAYFMIRGFQLFISPQDGANCRYRPTCSAYGKIAVLRYGAIVGGFLAGDRLIRCNPYNQPGYDPVPDYLFK